MENVFFGLWRCCARSLAPSVTKGYALCHLRCAFGVPGGSAPGPPVPPMFDSLLSFVLSGTEAERHWRSLRCGGLANPGQVAVQAAQAVLRRVTVTPTLNQLISLAGPTHVEPQAPVSPDGLTAYVLALLHRGGLWTPLPPKHPRHKHFPNSKEAPWVGGVRRAS